MAYKVACANGKGIKTKSKVRPKSIPKSMTNRHKFHARTRDTQNMETHQTSDQKNEMKNKKNSNKKKDMRKTNRKTNVKNAKPGRPLWRQGTV